VLTEKELEKLYRLREQKLKERNEKSEKAKGRGGEGKAKEDRARESARYWEKYDHKLVKVKLINGEELQGKLHVDWKCPYDVQLEMEDGKRILIPKHSVLYVTET